MSIVDPEIYNTIYDGITSTNNNSINLDIKFNNLNWKKIIFNLLIPLLILIMIIFFIKQRMEILKKQQSNLISEIDETFSDYE